MSPPRKSRVTTFGPALNTPMRPSPLIQYCHSSAFGCQCISRMAPGWSVTRAAEGVVEALNVVLSTTWIVPLRLLLTGEEAPILKVDGNGGVPPAATAL